MTGVQTCALPIFFVVWIFVLIQFLLFATGHRYNFAGQLGIACMGLVMGLILGSKFLVNIVELFIIFIERTIISLLIVTPIAHFIF